MIAARNNRLPKKKTVLCVDDEPLIRDLCVSALEDYRVLTAANAQEALELFVHEEIDITVSDVVMPGMSGLELLAAIKQQQPDSVVVLMTGYTDQETILQSLKAGAADFISKPINPLQLSTTIAHALEQQKIRLELDNLKRIDQLKSDFLGLISHKLKTPATAISLFVQNLADGIDSCDNDSFQQMLAIVQTETAHLEQLIQDLLYFSEATLDSAQTEIEEIDFAALADRNVSCMREKAREKGIDLCLKLEQELADTRLQLNSRRINFVIHALLDNALKFTPAGGTVKVTGGVENERVSLRISDTGVGIEPAELRKIFSKFYQIDPEQTGQVRGFGLGLYYARKFIRSMGGQLFLKSIPGQGTEVSIVFPLS